MFPVYISFLLFLFFVCVLVVWVLTECVPLNSVAISIAISYTPEKCQHHRLSFAVLAWGVDAAAGWNPRTNLELLGELLIACLWGDLSHRHCFTKLKKKKLCSKTITSDLIDFLP